MSAPAWYDVIAETEEQQRKMTPAQWRNEVNRMLRAAPDGQIIAVLASIMAMDRTRASPVAEVVRAEKSKDDVDWALWQDMVNEPEKYGDDIVEWLALDEEVRAGPKRWRVAAFWLEKDQQAETSGQVSWRKIYSVAAAAAAIAGERAWIKRDIKRHVTRRLKAIARIQAAVRGHQARTKAVWRDCCMCLSHRISPLTTGVGMMCRGCAEQGPHEEQTGPLADGWSEWRGDYC